MPDVGSTVAAGTDRREAELVAELRRAGVAGVDASSLRRALYSSDASLYRVVPDAVAYPGHVDELVAALEVCRRLSVPLTVRGAGTSIAGNAVGSGLVVDVSRHLNRIHEIDPAQRVAVVEPGVIQAQLQTAAAPYGLRFGPDPSTHNRCTIGGMIGNNACGSRALGYGRTSDNVEGLDVVTGTGERLHLVAGTAQRVGGNGGKAPQSSPSPALESLRALVQRNLATIRTEFGQFSRQASGYAMEHLLPERGFDVTRSLVGSEGTLAVVLGATVRLVTAPAARALLVLGYPGIAEAADAAPAVVPYRPTACEGLDSRVVEGLRQHHGTTRVPPLPRGAAWLFVELPGQSIADVESQAVRVASAAGAVDQLVVTDAQHAAALWRIREDFSGLAARTPEGRPAHAGWEDAAVPPQQLGRYLREFEELLATYGFFGIPYGHFGDGCVHVRIDFPLDRPGGTERFRAFLVDGAQLVAKYGGSISGEHGDGRARSELLPLMYSPAAIDLFANVKALFDPDGVLNPGVLVAPRPVDADLRAVQDRPLRHSLAFRYRHDRGDLSMAVHRCNGTSKCRADLTDAGGVMCPSYTATRDEKDSTRGRARVLQEMVNGSLVSKGWRSPEVHAALDLCLSCKGCANDCPTGIDMATYKAEVLYQTYRRRLRPPNHYALGWLPAWVWVASRTPAVANALMNAPGLRPMGKWAAGVDQRRSLPTLARESFRRWFARRPQPVGGGRPVLLWVDTFTDYFSPDVGAAAVRVLEAAGYAVRIPDRPICCGLTWISTGQLGVARRMLRRSLKAVRRELDAGLPVVGLEPSCTAVLRHDGVELLETPAADRLAGATHTLAELLTRTDGWTPPDLTGTTLVAQPHCHHASVLGWDTDAALLRKAGATVRRVGGCCGLAGNWGVERGHYDVSVAVAEYALLPAVRDAPNDAVVLADGFSCRTQLADLVGVSARHLAQLLDR
jgi:FAD/FMN-containing dehydrogenase/Fe-S oxidoreductase